MPQLMHPGDRVDDLTSAAIHVVDAEGVTAFTLRRIAAAARLSPSSVLSHLDNKSRLTDLVTKRISERLVVEIRSGVRSSGVLGLVPEAELLPLLRSWLAMCELARADDGLGASVAYLLEEFHRDLVQWACRLPHDDTTGLDVMHALVVGLWTQMCARSAPMSPDRARAALRHACGGLGIPVGPAPD